MSDGGSATLEAGAPASLAALFAAMGPRVARAPGPSPDTLMHAAEAHGRALGRADAAADLAPLAARLTAAVASAEAATIVDAAALAPLFVELVGRVARAVIDVELRVSGEAVARLAAAALAAIDVDGGVTVFVNADDAALLSAVDVMGQAMTVDPALPPGDVRVETPRHVIAASLSARLADIVAGLA